MSDVQKVIDELLPIMTPNQQKQVLKQLAKKADKECKEEARRDPLNKIPTA